MKLNGCRLPTNFVSVIGLCISLCLPDLASGAPAAIQTPAAIQAPAAGERQDVVWIEGEAPASITPAALKPNIAGWGHPDYLSGRNWLQISIDADKVETQTPADGIVLSYAFAVPRSTSYQVWNRVGYERVRSPFQWRIDDGPWSTISPDQDTLDVEELTTWNPVAWLEMGTTKIDAGPHSLQIRLPRTKDEKGNTAKILYASDAICLDAGAFHPDGPHRPGDGSWRTDADRAAAVHVFAAGAPSTPTSIPLRDGRAAQESLPLRGDWEIARADEPVVADRTGPITALPDPSDLSWQAIPVPGDRNQSVPELTYVHRYFLRCRVSIPATDADHSFFLHFPSVNLIATLFVNDQSCGWTKAPFATWDCDITHAVRPGQVNTIVVGMKDPFYALADEADARHIQYIPYDFWHYNTTNQLDFPILSHYQTGILQTPTLVMAGPAYTSDVFAIPSVKNRTLGLEITVNNPAAQPASVIVENSVYPLAGGAAAKTFAPQTLIVPAGQNAVLKTTETWTNPRLWWPDAPQQYHVVTRLMVNGRVIDERTTKFGFREWGWNGPTFTLNGIPWHGRADLVDYGKADAAAVATWRRHGQNMERLWGETSWGGEEIADALDFYDAAGVPIRRTGIFDGEGAAGFYNLTEQVRENGKDVTVARRALFDNWRTQLAAWVRGQRNHPSIFIWSMENEITFINSSVFGNNPYTDPEMRRAAAMLSQIDPTRPQMVDGGNALLDQSLPVYGGHYMEPPIESLPEGAYDYAAMEHRQKWPMTEVKPVLLGESFFASGTEQSNLAAVGGERAFVGKAEAHPAVGLTARMLSEGYRWNGLSFQFWFGGETDAHYIAWQPVAVLCRQWDWTFGSGQHITRTLGIFNDSRFSDPITLTWTLRLDGRTASTHTAVYHVPAGASLKFDVSLPIPTAARREEGDWILSLTTRGRQVFRDVKAVSVLPSVRAPAAIVAAATSRTATSRTATSRTATSRTASSRTASSRTAASRTAASRSAASRGAAFHRLLVYDPAGTAAAFLRRLGVPFTALRSLDSLPAEGRVLLVGRDALNTAESTSSRLAAYASAGRSIIVLEQKTPLRYQALPGAMSAESNQGYIAFAEDLDSPVLRGLAQKDFFTWGNDGLVYRNAYLKPTSGGKSLVECGDGLAYTALAEMDAGKGVLLLSQLVIERDLTSSAAAQRLLVNLLGYAASYRRVFHPVEVAARDNPPLLKALNATGLQYTGASSALNAISRPGTIAVISATPANLHALAASPARVSKFTGSGGWIVLNNLTPVGLADYNKLVGYDHMIRPFKQEKVTWPAVRSPLTAGLATSNIVMGSGKQIFNFAAGQYPDPDAYSFVVDYDEVAPFGKSPFYAYDNITNNFTMADGFWPLIINLGVPDSGKPLEVPITLPRPQTITRFTWVSDNNYEGTTKVNLVFNGTDRVSFNTVPNGDPQTFAINPPRTAKNITLQVAGWQNLPDKLNNGKVLIGIDNIYLFAARPAGFYNRVRPLLNVGAMMEYPRGPGGIVLCNVKFKDTETVPENAGKKQAIIAAILRNLHAPFSGGKSIIAGAGSLNTVPVDLSKQANQYTGDRGWFGDRTFTFADLPAGTHTLAGVPYHVYSFATSIVPTVVMLGGSGIPGNLPEQVTGIPVNRKADALFFLQAARIDRRRSPDEVRQGKRYEMADYVIHYADGTQVKVPITSEIDVENYKQETPAAIPGAQIAWTRPYPGTPYSAVAYSMQWNNPRPGVAIRSIDLVYGPDRVGVPALLAITAATAE